MKRIVINVTVIALFLHLKRAFSLETAGYACRDVQTRLDTIAD